MMTSTKHKCDRIRPFHCVCIHFVILFLLQWAVLSSHSEAFAFTPPQPPGLSPDSITDLARKRYSTEENGMPMKHKVAVITGAAGGIGRELSKILYNLGATVVALDCNTTGLDFLQKSLSEGSDDDGRVVTIPTRQEDLASVAKSAEQIKIQFDAIDLLINNAGMTYPSASSPKLSAHGNDLLFTVNYLSHFLLTEKLLPLLSNGRIVQLTSTYHWKVDGSELIPLPDGSGPLAHQGDPAKQSPQFVERSYGNSKLAQIWHARSIRSAVCAVCACPTWVGTGIAGEEARDFLETFAFPVSGAGITSAINAIFRTDAELNNALGDCDCLVANSRILEYLPGKKLWLTSKIMTDLGWRDAIADLLGLALLLGQRFTHESFIIQRSSPESYENKAEREAFYEWSLKEVEPWL